jgi:hypothetical protein
MTVKQRRILLLLIVLGTFIQGLTMFRSGLNYSYGLGFWGPNGHDGVWHVALINQVLNGFPPSHPTFAGMVLNNYHFFYDLLIAVINKVFLIPVINLYFQIMPVVLAFLLGILSFFVGSKLSKNFWVGFWFAFLNYFAGSFGYLISLIKDRSLGGESLFWSMQSISTQINPPFALSLVLILLGILLLVVLKKIQLKEIIILSLIFGILINIKVYAGIIILPSLFVYSLIKRQKGYKQYLKIFIGASLISLVIFLLVNKNSASLLVFQPFWFIHSMIESPDRLYLVKLAVARYTYFQSGIWGRLIVVELIGLLIFIVGNAGMRLFGIFSWVGKLRRKDFSDVEIFISVAAMIALLIPLLFVQKGTAWNTIQFFYYFLFFLNFYTAIFISKINRPLLICLFILLTVPTTYSSLKNYTGLIPPSALPENEIKALNFLKIQPNGYVLTYPFSPYEKGKLRLKEPIPLYAYATTAYVSAFSGKQTYLEDEMNLDISNFYWQARRKAAENYFSGATNEFEAWGFLLNNKIRYIYLVNDQVIQFPIKDWQIQQIYNDQNIRIYRTIW